MSSLYKFLSNFDMCKIFLQFLETNFTCDKIRIIINTMNSLYINRCPEDVREVMMRSLPSPPQEENSNFDKRSVRQTPSFVVSSNTDGAQQPIWRR